MLDSEKLLNNPLYIENLKTIANAQFIPWSKLSNKSILIIGATGLIGSCLIDLLMYVNKHKNLNINITATSRNFDKAKARFGVYFLFNNFKYFCYDCSEPFPKNIGAFDFAIHAASNTHPLAYSSDPVGTITTNVFGLYNLLEHLKNYNSCRVLFLSSVEIYGENNTEKNDFKETDLGYLDCNTMRAGYPESKRVSEALCQAYINKFTMDIVIARLSRTFGPTMLENDSKALSQFLKKAINNEDIVLKSEGSQYYSYIYTIDAVSALLTIMLKGKTSEAYNVAHPTHNITLKDLANMIAKYTNNKVIFEIPEAEEQLGYSKATKAILNSDKLQSLGWSCKKNINDNIVNCIDILRLLNKI